MSFEINNIDLINQLGLLVTLKDLELRYVGASHVAARLLGFKNAHEIEGLTNYEIKCEAVSLAPKFISQDMTVLRSKRSLTTLIISPYNGDMKFFLGERVLLHDHQQNVVGVGAKYTDLLNQTSIDMSTLLDELMLDPRSFDKLSQCFEIKQPTNELARLSPRELEVLFFLLRGKTYKGIASRLQIRACTVETHIDNIKSKLGCANKSTLIEKAIDRGALALIPTTLATRLTNNTEPVVY